LNYLLDIRSGANARQPQFWQNVANDTVFGILLPQQALFRALSRFWRLLDVHICHLVNETRVFKALWLQMNQAAYILNPERENANFYKSGEASSSLA
jgi:hypothetical protein